MGQTIPPGTGEIPPAIAAIDRPIVLVGMMGSGKSSVGRRLAARLHRSFFDADDEIEAAAGRTISEIFAAHGEPYFRDGERRVITRLLGHHRSVLATGGGAFAQGDTRALILERGIAIWLDVPLPILVERVARRSHRPLLNGRNAEDTLRDLLDRRAPDYAMAPIRVTTDGGSHSMMVDRIMAALEDFVSES